MTLDNGRKDDGGKQTKLPKTINVQESSNICIEFDFERWLEKKGKKSLDYSYIECMVDYFVLPNGTKQSGHNRMLESYEPRLRFCGD